MISYNMINLMFPTNIKNDFKAENKIITSFETNIYSKYFYLKHI